jgi:indolepyruvate decarboxylase
LKKSVAQITGSLKTAVRPLVWLGIEVDRFGLQEKAARLLQQLNIPFVTELLSKSTLPEDNPLFVGVFDGQASLDVVIDLAKNADFILALGVWLTDINSLGSDPDFAKTAFVSLDAVRFGADYYPHIALEDMIDALLKENVRREPQDVRRRPEYEAPDVKPDDQITYQGFYDFIPQYIDENTIVGSDASMNYFGSLLLEVRAPGGFISQSSYSSIGYIGAAATGICLAKKSSERVIVFSGDGGFQMTAQCLSTQTRFGLNPVIVVIDNGVYGVEQWLADASVFLPEKKDAPFYKSCELHRWNYSKLADVVGCQGWKASTYGELKAALDGALKNLTSPSIIQVVVPSKSIPFNATWKTN